MHQTRTWGSRTFTPAIEKLKPPLTLSLLATSNDFEYTRCVRDILIQIAMLLTLEKTFHSWLQRILLSFLIVSWSPIAWLDHVCTFHFWSNKRISFSFCNIVVAQLLNFLCMLICRIVQNSSTKYSYVNLG